MNIDQQLAHHAGPAAGPVIIPASVAAAGTVASNQLAALADVLENMDLDKLDSYQLEATLTTLAARIRSLAQVTYFSCNPFEEQGRDELVRKLKGH